MTRFDWLALHQSAIDGPVLVENTNVYTQLLNQLGHTQPYIALLIRGSALMPGENQISLDIIGQTGVIMDCSLHLQHQRTQIKGGPLDPNVTLHHLGSRQQLPSANIAQQLYSLVLAPLSTCILLIENEFRSLDEIIFLLASWAYLSTGQQCYTRPVVRNARSSRPGYLEGGLEFRMTGKILSDFNPGREHTARTAEAVWRRRFSRIIDLDESRDTLSIYKQAISLTYPNRSLSTRRLRLLMHSGCIHFAQCPTILFSIMRASRAFPLPGHLFEEITRVIENEVQDAPKLPINRLVASVLLMDRHFAGLDGKLILK